MVRETRHLWVGNLPDNIREERILEHFKRYGRVQSVKFLPKKDDENAGGVCATVAFIDIKSASKAHSSENKIDERTLKTDYYEPSTPSTASSAIHIHERDEGLGLRTHPAASLYPPPPARNQRYSHGLAEERGYERSSHYYERTADRENFMRRPVNYHEDELYQGRGRTRDRAYRGGATAAGYQATVDRTQPIYRSHNSRPHFDQQRYAQTTEQYGEDRDSSSGRLSRTSPGRTKPRQNRSCSRSGSESRSRSPSRSSTGSQSSSSISGTRSSSSSSESSGSHSQSGSRSRSPSWSSSKTGKNAEKPSSVATTPMPQLQSAVSTPAPLSSILSVGIASFNNSNSMDSTIGDKDDKRHLGICVRNLPVRSSDTSLKDGLFHEYKKHGKVTMVKVIGQGTERYAVVCFKKPEDVEKAMEVSKDKLFFGSKIEVTPYEGVDVDDNEFRPLEAELDEYHPKATRTLFIGNLEKDITAAELRKHFEQFGDIIEIDIKKQGAVSSYAFVQYSDIASVVKAMRKMDGEHLGTNRIKLGFGKSMPTSCVWLDGIADTVTEKFLTRQFTRFGPVAYPLVDREKGHALVFYERMDYAQIAVSEMRGRALGGKKLQIDFASRECQLAFQEKMEMSGQQLPADRQWDRRQEPTFEAREPEREIRIGYENHGRGYNRFENQQQRGRGNFRGAQRGTFPTRGRGQTVGNRYENFHETEFVDRRHSRGLEDDYSQGSGASYDDSYEQELREYGFSQRERRDYSGEELVTRERSFSPIQKIERSLSPRERLREDQSVSPHTPRLVEPVRRNDRLFERYDSGREEEIMDDKRTKYYGIWERMRRKQRQRSVSDQDSFHSQSPPNSRHQSRSNSPAPPKVESRIPKDKTLLCPRSPVTPMGSPGLDNSLELSSERDSVAEQRDLAKRKLSENKIDLRDLLPKSSITVGSDIQPPAAVVDTNCESGVVASLSTTVSLSKPRTKIELDRSRFKKVFGVFVQGENEPPTKTDLVDYQAGDCVTAPTSLATAFQLGKEHTSQSRVAESVQTHSVGGSIPRYPRSQSDSGGVMPSVDGIETESTLQSDCVRDKKPEASVSVEVTSADSSVARPVIGVKPRRTRSVEELQNEKVHLLHLIEQLDEHVSSGDEEDKIRGKVAASMCVPVDVSTLTNFLRITPPAKRPKLGELKNSEVKKDTNRLPSAYIQDTKETNSVNETVPSVATGAEVTCAGNPDMGSCTNTVPLQHNVSSSTKPTCNTQSERTKPTVVTKGKRPPLERMEVLRGNSLVSLDGTEADPDSVANLQNKRPKHGPGPPGIELGHATTKLVESHTQQHLQKHDTVSDTGVTSSVVNEQSSIDKPSLSSKEPPHLVVSSSHHLPHHLLKSPSKSPGDSKSSIGPVLDEHKRDRDTPLSLPLPRFANAVMSPKLLLSSKPNNLKSPPSMTTTCHKKPSVSVSSSTVAASHGSCQLASSDHLSASSVQTPSAAPVSPVPAVVLPSTLPEIAEPDKTEGPTEAPKVETLSPRLLPVKVAGGQAKASLNPTVESSSDSEHSPLSSPNRPSLEERIRILDEKYNAWSGSAHSLTSSSITSSTDSVTSASVVGGGGGVGNSTPKMDYDKYNIKRRTNFLASNDIGLRTEPSDIVKSLLAKTSIFDQDSKRLEHINEKYEPKELSNLDAIPKTSRCFRTKAAAKEFFSPLVNQPPHENASTVRLVSQAASASLPSKPVSSTTMTSSSTLPVLQATELSPTTLHSNFPLTTSTTLITMTVTSVSVTASASTGYCQTAAATSHSPRSSSVSVDVISKVTPSVSNCLPRKLSEPARMPSILKREPSTSPGCAFSQALNHSSAKTPVVASVLSTSQPISTTKKDNNNPHTASSSEISKTKVLVAKKDPRESHACKKDIVHGRETAVKDPVQIESVAASSSSVFKEVPMRKESFSKDSGMNPIKKESSSSPPFKEQKLKKETSVKDPLRKDSTEMSRDLVCKKDPTPATSGSSSSLQKDHLIKKEAPSLVTIANKRRMTSTDSTESESGKSEKDGMKKCESKLSEPEPKKPKLCNSGSSSAADEKSSTKKTSTLNHGTSSSSVVRKLSKSHSLSSSSSKISSSSKGDKSKDEKRLQTESKSLDEHDKEKSNKSIVPAATKLSSSKDDKNAKHKTIRDSIDGSVKSSKPKHENDVKSKEKKPKDENKKKKDKVKTKEKKSSSSDKSKSEQSRQEKKLEKLLNFFDSEPVYFSMYDKVKARSSQNEKAKEKEKELESVREKFNQLKQSRAKREEKCKSTSVEYDSDRDSDCSEHSNEASDSKMSPLKNRTTPNTSTPPTTTTAAAAAPAPAITSSATMKKRKLVIESSSSDDEVSTKFERRTGKKTGGSGAVSRYQKVHSDDDSDSDVTREDSKVANLLSTSLNASLRKDRSSKNVDGRRDSQMFQSDVFSSDSELPHSTVSSHHSGSAIEQALGKKQKSKARKKSDRESSMSSNKSKSQKKKLIDVLMDNSDVEIESTRTKTHSSKPAKVKKTKSAVSGEAVKPADLSSDSEGPVFNKSSTSMPYQQPRVFATSKDSYREHGNMHHLDVYGSQSNSLPSSSSIGATGGMTKEKKKKVREARRLGSSDEDVPVVDQKQQQQRSLAKKKRNKSSKNKDMDKPARFKSSKERISSGKESTVRREDVKSDDDVSLTSEPTVRKSQEWPKENDFDRRRRPSLEDRTMGFASFESDSKDVDSWLNTSTDQYMLPSPPPRQPKKDRPVQKDGLVMTSFNVNVHPTNLNVDNAIKRDEKQKSKKKIKEKRAKSKLDSDKSGSTKAESSHSTNIAKAVDSSCPSIVDVSDADDCSIGCSSSRNSQLAEAVKTLEWHLQDIESKSFSSSCFDTDLEETCRSNVSKASVESPRSVVHPGDPASKFEDPFVSVKKSKGKGEAANLYDVFDFKDEPSSDKTQDRKSPADSRKPSEDSSGKSNVKKLKKKPKKVKEECVAKPEKETLLKPEEPPAARKQLQVTPKPDKEAVVRHAMSSHVVETLSLQSDAECANERIELPKASLNELIPEFLDTSRAQLQDAVLEPIHVMDKCEAVDQLYLVDDKGMAISQEETDDAIKALLGETFGGECFDTSHSTLMEDADDKADSCDGDAGKTVEDEDDQSIISHLDVMTDSNKNITDSFYEKESIPPHLPLPPPLPPPISPPPLPPPPPSSPPPISPPLPPQPLYSNVNDEQERYETSFDKESESQFARESDSSGELTIDEHASLLPEKSEEDVSDTVPEELHETNVPNEETKEVVCSTPTRLPLPNLKSVFAKVETTVDETEPFDLYNVPTPNVDDEKLADHSFRLSDSFSENKPKRARRSKTRKLSEPGGSMESAIEHRHEVATSVTPPRHIGGRRSRIASGDRARMPLRLTGDSDQHAESPVIPESDAISQMVKKLVEGNLRPARVTEDATVSSLMGFLPSTFNPIVPKNVFTSHVLKECNKDTVLQPDVTVSSLEVNKSFSSIASYHFPQPLPHIPAKTLESLELPTHVPTMDPPTSIVSMDHPTAVTLLETPMWPVAAAPSIVPAASVATTEPATSLAFVGPPALLDPVIHTTPVACGPTADDVSIGSSVPVVSIEPSAPVTLMGSSALVASIGHSVYSASMGPLTPVTTVESSAPVISMESSGPDTSMGSSTLATSMESATFSTLMETMASVTDASVLELSSSVNSGETPSSMSASLPLKVPCDKHHDASKLEEPKKGRRGRKKKSECSLGNASSESATVEEPIDENHPGSEPRTKVEAKVVVHLAEMKCQQESKKTRHYGSYGKDAGKSPFDVFEFRDEEDEDIVDFGSKKDRKEDTKFGNTEQIPKLVVDEKRPESSGVIVPSCPVSIQEAEVPAITTSPPVPPVSVASVVFAAVDQLPVKEERDATVERVRPRLILTIKSPHKDSHERTPKVETREEPPLRYVESKVEDSRVTVVSTDVSKEGLSQTGNGESLASRSPATRKSQRLQEKSNRSTIDEIIEDVVKGNYGQYEGRFLEADGQIGGTRPRRTRSRARAEEAHTLPLDSDGGLQIPSPSKSDPTGLEGEHSIGDPKGGSIEQVEGSKTVSLRTFRITRTQARSEASSRVTQDGITESEDSQAALKGETSSDCGGINSRPRDNLLTDIRHPKDEWQITMSCASESQNASHGPGVSTDKTVSASTTSSTSSLQGQLVMKVELPKAATSISATHTKTDGALATSAPPETTAGVRKSRDSKEGELCPTALVDPVTGFLTPVKQLDEGTYIPAATNEDHSNQAQPLPLTAPSIISTTPSSVQRLPLVSSDHKMTNISPLVTVGSERPSVMASTGPVLPPPPLIPSRPTSIETPTIVQAPHSASSVITTCRASHTTQGSPSVAASAQHDVAAAGYDQAAIQSRNRSLSMPHIQAPANFVGEPPVDISGRSRANSVPTVPPPLMPVSTQSSSVRCAPAEAKTIVPVSAATHRSAISSATALVAPVSSLQGQPPIGQPMPGLRPHGWPMANSSQQPNIMHTSVPPLTQVQSARSSSTYVTTGSKIVQSTVLSTRESATKSNLATSFNPDNGANAVPSAAVSASSIKHTAPLKIHVVQPPVRASDIPGTVPTLSAPSIATVIGQERESPTITKTDQQPHVSKVSTADPVVAPLRVSVADVASSSSTARSSSRGHDSQMYAEINRGPAASNMIGMPSPIGQAAKVQQQQMQSGTPSPKGGAPPRHSPVLLQQASYPMSHYEAALHSYGATGSGGVTIAELLQNNQYLLQHKEYLANHPGGNQMMERMSGQLLRPGTPGAVHPDVAARLGNPTPPHTPTPPNHQSLTAQGDMSMHLRHPSQSLVVHPHHPHLGRHHADMAGYMPQPLVYAHPHYSATAAAAIHPELRAQQEAHIRAAALQGMGSRIGYPGRHPHDARLMEAKHESKLPTPESRPGSSKTPQQQQAGMSDTNVSVKEEKSSMEHHRHSCREEGLRDGRRSTPVEAASMQKQQQMDSRSSSRVQAITSSQAQSLRQPQAQYPTAHPHVSRQQHLAPPHVSVSPHDRTADSPTLANLYCQGQAGRVPSAHNATSTTSPYPVSTVPPVEQTASSRHHKMAQAVMHGSEVHDSKNPESGDIIMTNHHTTQQRPSMVVHPMEAMTSQLRMGSVPMAGQVGAGSNPYHSAANARIQQHRVVSLVKQDAMNVGSHMDSSRPPEAHRPQIGRSPVLSIMHSVSPPPAHSSRLASIISNPSISLQHAPTGQILPPTGGIHLMPQPGCEAPQQPVPHNMAQSVAQSRSQLQTPPHASQVPPQGDSLLMLLKRYPIMWQGLLALKNDQAVVEMHFVSGNPLVARASLPGVIEGGISSPLRIAQRMRLEQAQLDGVARRMQMEGEHCMMLALPCGRDQMDVLQQSESLKQGIITYLQQKQAAGIANVAVPGSQQPAYVIHVFPCCDFSNENLNRIAPDLLHSVMDIAHLLIVVTTVCGF